MPIDQRRIFKCRSAAYLAGSFACLDQAFGFPKLLDFLSPFPHPYKYRIRTCTDFHRSASPLTPFNSTGLFVGKKLQSISITLNAPSKGAEEESVSQSVISACNGLWHSPHPPASLRKKKNTMINVPDFLVQFQSLEEGYRP